MRKNTMMRYIQEGMKKFMDNENEKVETKQKLNAS